MAKVIFTDTLPTGEHVIFRYPQKEDVGDMLEYINTLSKEQTYILFQGRQQTLEEEKEYIAHLLKKIAEKKAITLLIEIDGRIVGNSGIEMKEDAIGHEGFFGISIAKAYRGKGLGKKLMQLVLEEAKKELPTLEIVTLTVFGNNLIAQTIYKQFGFVEFGVLPKGIKHKGEYVDHLFMYKRVI